MAKSHETFDQIFKEKLEGHEVKPSALAWERLDSQLPKSKKSGSGFWWAIAASLSALLLVAYLNWPAEVVISEDRLVASAEEAEEPVNSPVEILQKPEVSTPETSSPESVLPKPQAEPKQSQSNFQETPATLPASYKETKAQPLLAEATQEMEKSIDFIAVPEKKISEPELSLPTLKAPDLTKTVAEAPSSTSEEPLYRVSIYSNGIKKAEPTEKNLITEIGKTVSQVEGLLGKVDEGFAEIQDKKDNLFASLTTKRERADEKP